MTKSKEIQRFKNLLEMAPFVRKGGYSFIMIDFEDWLKMGIEQGWCGPAVCFTHDGYPTTEEEDSMDEDDMCIHGIRLYDNAEQKKQVEDNHSPSTWRATNRGIDV
jgi:hypothetical protein